MHAKKNWRMILKLSETKAP